MPLFKYYYLYIACGGQPNCVSCTTPGKCSTCSDGFAHSLDGTKCNGT